MPAYEYRCGRCNAVKEVFFKTISAGDGFDVMACPDCGGRAEKIFSVPLGFGLYGNPEGYSKPSATKRFSNKVVCQKTGNDSAVG